MDVEHIAWVARRIAIEVLFGCVVFTMGLVSYGGALVAHERIASGDTKSAMVIAAVTALQSIGLIWLIRKRI